MNNNLKRLLVEIDVFKRSPIKKKDITDDIKDSVIKMGDLHYTCDDLGMSNDEIKIAVMAVQAKDVRTIKTILLATVIIVAVSSLLMILPMLA